MEKAPQNSAEDKVTTPRRIRALLIEDNPGDARLIELMLAEADGKAIELRHVERLEDGLRELSNGTIDVVLSDLSVPDSHGLETFQRLHARAPHVPIIVLSGLNDTTVALSAVHQGAQDYLIKGEVNGQLLARSMRYAIERKGMSEQLHR
ncbi:MAG TPA: response regulator, partial [Verrucomicrobiae bacterium]|nr:response regulator [Verrucomicrobiae bacterium]